MHNTHFAACLAQLLSTVAADPSRAKASAVRTPTHAHSRHTHARAHTRACTLIETQGKATHELDWVTDAVDSATDGERGGWQSEGERSKEREGPQHTTENTHTHRAEKDEDGEPKTKNLGPLSDPAHPPTHSSPACVWVCVGFVAQ